MKNKIEVDSGIKKDCPTCFKNAGVNKIMESFFSDKETFKKIKKQRNDLAHDNEQINNEDINNSIDEMINLLKNPQQNNN